MMRKLGYLSGAPRTSTNSIASLTGGRQHILGTIGGFRANGWAVETCIVGDYVPEEWLKAGHEMSKGKSFVQRLGADVLRILLSAKYIRRALKEIPSPDWVYERHAAYQLFGYFFQRRGIPWILETNGPLFDQAASDLKHVALPALLRWSERYAYRKCDILVVISDDLKRILIEQLKICPKKIVVLPNAADAETFNPDIVKPRRLFDADTFIIGFQGAMYDWAGLPFLLRTIAEMRRNGLGVAAVLLGDGHERKRLEALAAELDIADYVKFPGRVPRESVPQYIAGYDLCYSGQINLSTKSMYLSPLKLYDYMAMGKPVIASRFADAVTLTKDGRLGYIFAPEDLDDLVATAMRAYHERAALPEMGAALRAEILEHHTWTHRVRDFIATADALLGKEPARNVS